MFDKEWKIAGKCEVDAKFTMSRIYFAVEEIIWIL
jgi:hypothetical protein